MNVGLLILFFITLGSVSYVKQCIFQNFCFSEPWNCKLCETECVLQVFVPHIPGIMYTGVQGFYSCKSWNCKLRNCKINLYEIEFHKIFAMLL